MSLVLPFEIGLWNAWIFILPYVYINYSLGHLIMKDKQRRNR